MIKRASSLLILTLIFAAHSASAVPKKKTCPEYSPPLCENGITVVKDADGCTRPICKEAKKPICGKISVEGGGGIAAVMPRFYITVSIPNTPGAFQRYRLQDGKASVDSLMADKDTGVCLSGAEVDSKGSSEKTFAVDAIHRNLKKSKAKDSDEEADTESAY